MYNGVYLYHKEQETHQERKVKGYAGFNRNKKRNHTYAMERTA